MGAEGPSNFRKKLKTTVLRNAITLNKNKDIRERIYINPDLTEKERTKKT